MAHIPWPLSQYNIFAWLYTETHYVGIRNVCLFVSPVGSALGVTGPYACYIFVRQFAHILANSHVFTHLR